MRSGYPRRSIYSKRNTAKIALAREKHKRICQIIHDLRHSLPQKEGYSTEQKSNNITTPQTRMLQGFRCEHFNSLT